MFLLFPCDILIFNYHVSVDSQCDDPFSGLLRQVIDISCIPMKQVAVLSCIWLLHVRFFDDSRYCEVDVCNDSIAIRCVKFLLLSDLVVTFEYPYFAFDLRITYITSGF